ncbi:hypothetical protein, partial [Corynebacterium falsenii]|uniref:hypothetical protein n=1 Tax=Corynebacterium falsenii TaxID=108486 RepID=UPI001C722EDC
FTTHKTTKHNIVTPAAPGWPGTAVPELAGIDEHKPEHARTSGNKSAHLQPVAAMAPMTAMTTMVAVATMAPVVEMAVLR